jgi:hypothetical protein
METQKIELEIPALPEGYDRVSYRLPKQGEWFLDYGKWTQSHIDFQNQLVMVAERSKQYREPTLPADCTRFWPLGSIGKKSQRRAGRLPRARSESYRSPKRSKPCVNALES